MSKVRWVQVIDLYSKRVISTETTHNFYRENSLNGKNLKVLSDLVEGVIENGVIDNGILGKSVLREAIIIVEDTMSRKKTETKVSELNEILKDHFKNIDSILWGDSKTEKIEIRGKFFNLKLKKIL